MKWLGFGATNLSHATKLTSSKLAKKSDNTQLFYIMCYVALIIMTESSMGKSFNYKIGDLITVKEWTKEWGVPKMLKCLKYDEEWGVVWYNNNGKRDNIGVAHIRKSNFIERVKWWASF